MRADPEFLKRVEAKDAAAFSDYNKAWRVSRGLPAEPVQEINAENIFKETDARIAARLKSALTCCARTASMRNKSIRP